MKNILILLVLVNLSCDKIGMNHSKEVSSKTVVVLYDLSSSANSLKNMYIESSKKIIENTNFSDSIVAAKITTASVTESEFLIQEKMPSLNLVDKKGNEINNSLLVNKKKKELAEELDKKQKEAFEKLSNKLHLDYNYTMSDIMSSIQVAEKIFKSIKNEKLVLVIYSDMIEYSKFYNFEKENLTETHINTIIENEKKSNRIPDLKGVKVFIVAANSGDSQTFFAVQNFWLKYFQESGAILSKENYGSSLIQFKE